MEKRVRLVGMVRLWGGGKGKGMENLVEGGGLWIEYFCGVEGCCVVGRKEVQMLKPMKRDHVTISGRSMN